MRVWFGIILLFSAGGPLSADPPTESSPEDSKAIQSRIADLSSPQRQARLTAERALLEMGPEILPLLPGVEELPNASSREAVRRIRIQLERLDAEVSIRPATVHWPAPLPLGDAVAALREQTGNPIELHVEAPLAERTFTPPEKPQTFWSAVAQIEAEFELHLVAGPARTLRLVQNRESPPALWSGHTGILRVQLREMIRKPIAGRDDELLRLEWTMQFEPRLRPLLMKLKLDDNTVHTQNGTKLEPFSPGSVIELTLGQSHEPTQLRMDYRLPRQASTRELTCQLQLPVLIAAGSQVFEFPGALQGQTQTVRHGGAYVTLFPAHQAFDRWNVPLKVIYDTGGPAFESHRNWFYQNEIQLRSGDNIYRPEQTPQLSLGANGVLGLEYTFALFAGKSDEAVLSYRIPTRLIESTWTIDATHVSSRAETPQP